MISEKAIFLTWILPKTNEASLTKSQEYVQNSYMEGTLSQNFDIALRLFTSKKGNFLV